MEPWKDSEPESSFDLRYYWTVVKKRLWVIIAVTLLVPAVTVALALRKPKVYAATATVVVNPQAPKVLGGQAVEVVPLGSGSEWVNADYFNTQVDILTSRSLARQTVAKYGLHKGGRLMPETPDVNEEAALDAAAKILQGKIGVTLRKESRVFAISVSDGNPRLAAELANDVADVYAEQNIDVKRDVTGKAKRWVAERLDKARGDVNKADTALYTFRKDNNILSVTLEDQQSMMSKALASFAGALSEKRQKRMELEARRKAIGPLVDGDPEDAPATYALSAPTLEKLRAAYLDEKLKQRALEERYGPKWPALLTQDARTQMALADLRAEVKTVMRGMDAEVKALADAEARFSTEVNRLTQEALDVNKKEITYKRLARDAKNADEVYGQLLTRLNESGLEEQEMDAANNIHPLDSAEVPTTPVAPNVRLAGVLGLGLGLLLAFCLAFLVELFDRSVKGQEDVESIIGLPFLGLVPSIDPAEQKAADGADMHVLRHPNSTVAECCRVVRTNIMFCSPDKPLRTMLVTSPNPVDGKTMTVLNLGMVMAQSGQRTLLVDTDMRRPRLHKAMRLGNENGVSRLILGETEIEAAVKETEIPNLYLLPCGPIPPNPAELLQTEKFTALIARLSQRFDRVIFDSPPVLAVTDAAVLARQVDGAIIVVRAGRTAREAVIRAKRALTSVNAHITGVVLNDVNLRSPHYASYYNYYHYQYHDAPARAPGRTA